MRWMAASLAAAQEAVNCRTLRGPYLSHPTPASSPSDLCGPGARTLNLVGNGPSRLERPGGARPSSLDRASLLITQVITPLDDVLLPLRIYDPANHTGGDGHGDAGKWSR